MPGSFCSTSGQALSHKSFQTQYQCNVIPTVDSQQGVGLLFQWVCPHQGICLCLEHALRFCLEKVRLCLQAELEDLCFAVLHPYEYTALRNELNAMWGLQQITDLVPAQAETLLSQAAARVKTAAEIAASSELPQPRLPASSPVPRPSLLKSSEEPTSQGSGSADDSRQQSAQSMHSVQQTAGDLYASSERGMVRTAGRARINSRQQKALQSGLLRLTSPARHKRGNSALAVLDPETLPASSPASSRPASSAQSNSTDNNAQPAASASALASASTSASAFRSRQRSNNQAAPSGSDSSQPPVGSNFSTLPQPSSPTSRAASHSSSPDSHRTEETTDRPDAAGNRPQRVIRGRAPRRALAAEMAAKAERQSSGSKAGPSSRLGPDYSFLSSDQQRVSHLLLDNKFNCQFCF